MSRLLGKELTINFTSRDLLKKPIDALDTAFRRHGLMLVRVDGSSIVDLDTRNMRHYSAHIPRPVRRWFSGSVPTEPFSVDTTLFTP